MEFDHRWMPLKVPRHGHFVEWIKHKLRVYLYFLGSSPVTGSTSGLCEQLYALSVNKEEVEFGFAGCELEIQCVALSCTSHYMHWYEW